MQIGMGALLLVQQAGPQAASNAWGLAQDGHSSHKHTAAVCSRQQHCRLHAGCRAQAVSNAVLAVQLATGPGKHAGMDQGEHTQGRDLSLPTGQPCNDCVRQGYGTCQGCMVLKQGMCQCLLMCMHELRMWSMCD